MEKLYVDTHIFADYWLARKDNLRPLGEFAHELFRDAASCKYRVLISKDVFEELKTIGLSEIDVKERLLDFLYIERKIEEVTVSESQEDEARKLSRSRKIPRVDVLHAILARDNSAILVTRDHHHEKVTDIVIIAKPEELL